MDIRTYYQKFMPIELTVKFLSLAMPGRFQFREFSFGYRIDGKEVYSRWLSFEDEVQLREAIERKAPLRIDVGAFYGTEPRLRPTQAEMFPIRREFVIDIDISDYDDVRDCTCGSHISAVKLCKMCWPFIAVAVEVIDYSLRKKFGLRDLIWFFSGRRGVHCWVTDIESSTFNDSYRTAIASYFEPWEKTHQWSSVRHILKPGMLAEFKPLHGDLLFDRFERMIRTRALNLNHPDVKRTVIIICKPRDHMKLTKDIRAAIDDKNNFQV